MILEFIKISCSPLLLGIHSSEIWQSHVILFDKLNVRKLSRKKCLNAGIYFSMLSSLLPWSWKHEFIWRCQKLWMVSICLKDREPRKSLRPKADFIWVRNKLILPNYWDFSIVDYTVWSRFSRRNVALKIPYRMIIYGLTF